MAGDPLIGTVIASHRIEAVIGEGGFSTVYRARHLRLPRTRALKILTVALTHDASFRERFERESRIAAELEHPRIVEVIDAGDEEGRLYILMRYIEGMDLGALLKREGPLQPQSAIRMLEQVAGALDAAHGQGLVHRDVKPQNILVGNDGRTYLSDFGIAKAAATRGPTRTGVFVGTPDYAAPEQFEAQPLDRRTDVYALAGVLYTALTGAVPYERTSDAQVMTAHMHEPPPRPSEQHPELPPALDDVIARGMAKAKDDRYATCGDLVDAAREALSGGLHGVASGQQQTIAAGTVPPVGPVDARTIDAGAVTAQPSAAPTRRAPAAASTTVPRAAQKPHRGLRSHTAFFAAAAAAVLVIAGVVAGLLLLRGGGSESLTLDNANAAARWRESELVSGSVRFGGTVAGPARLSALLKPLNSGSGSAGEGELAVRQEGNFQGKVALDPGARPGRYRLELSGTSGDTTLPEVSRVVRVPGPPEGFVDRAFISTEQGGSPENVLRYPQKQLWARFHFVSPPQAKAVHLVWRSPSLRRIGAITKPYAENVDTIIQKTPPLEPGAWSCILTVRGRTAKRVFVEIKAS